ncbi:MAG: cyclic di-GMP phosphodiesterase [Actinomycetota bacterium]|nr:cyclic di-GMP phosphodiesterase [Actinomycetota bacterium]
MASPRTAILVVEDTPEARGLLLRILESDGYEGVGAASALEARARLSEGDYAAILIDVRMPGESGLELLSHVRINHVDTAAIMVTALDDPGLVELALRTGAYGYVVKPYRVSELLINLANALHRRALEAQSRSYIRELEDTVVARTKVLRDSLAPLGNGQLSPIAAQDVIGRLSEALAVRDEETGFHVRRMSEYSGILAERLGLHSARGDVMRLASALHDVGKIGIPDAILQKPGPLSAPERASMQRHTVIGHSLLSGTESPLLAVGASIALTHHEKWDGTGYPAGLSGEAIPAEGRITAAADVFDALTSNRVYRRALPVDEALDVMRCSRATHFDPEILDAFLDCLDAILDLRDQYPDPVDKEAQSAHGPSGEAQ